MDNRRSRLSRLALAALVAGTLAISFAGTGSAGPVFKAGFGKRAITPVGPPPAEWETYLTPNPVNGVWSEPWQDLNGDGCMNGLTNHNLEPILDAEAPRGETPEPHVDEPWNEAGDGMWTGIATVRGVTIVGDPSSAGKWDGLWANAGFGSKCATGKHDDTWARAIVMELGDTRVALVSLDVVGLFNIEVQRIRKELAIRYPSLGIDEVVVASTHTHQGVDTMGYWGQLFLNTDGKFPAYQAFIRSQVLDAINDAAASLQPARAKFATGTQHVAIRDSRPPAVKDPRVPAAQFVDANDNVIGTVFGWSNHPEAQGSNNSLISSDFPHGARETMEAAFPGSTAVYFSGSVGGLQTPLGQDVPGFGSSPSWARTFELGRLVAQAAIDALANTAPVAVGELTAARRSFYMDMDNNVLRALNMRGIFDIPTYAGGESWGSSGHREGVPTNVFGPQVETEMVAVDLGAATFVTVPGELSPELVLGGYGRPDCPGAHTGRPHEPTLGDSFGPTTLFILGLGQDELGYIIPGYDFHITSVGQSSDGRGVVPVGGLEVSKCGEGHYEETVSGSSVFAPWVACVGKELAGKDPWSDPACSYENTHTHPYGVDPVPG